jgi:hypothetical protein
MAAGPLSLRTVVWTQARSALDDGVQIAAERVFAPWEGVEP